MSSLLFFSRPPPKQVGRVYVAATGLGLSGICNSCPPSTFLDGSAIRLARGDVPTSTFWDSALVSIVKVAGKGFGVQASVEIPRGSTIVIDQAAAKYLVDDSANDSTMRYKNISVKPSTQGVFEEVIAKCNVSTRYLNAMAHLKGPTERSSDSHPPTAGELWGNNLATLKPFLVNSTDRLLNPPSPAHLLDIVLTNVFGTTEICAVPHAEKNDGSVLFPAVSMFNTGIEVNVLLIGLANGFGVVRTLRDVAAGTELLVSYTSAENLLQIDQPLRSWGVTVDFSDNPAIVEGRNDKHFNPTLLRRIRASAPGSLAVGYLIRHFLSKDRDQATTNEMCNALGSVLGDDFALVALVYRLLQSIKNCPPFLESPRKAFERLICQ